MRYLHSKTISLIRKFYKKLSITKKGILLYIFLILIPACALMYFYYLRTSSVLEKEVTNSTLQALNQAEINISYRLDNIRKISNTIFMNSKLHDFLSRDNDDMIQQIEDAKELRNIVESAQSNADVFKVRLFVENSKILSGEDINFFSLDDIKKKDWYKDLANENGGIYWKSTYNERFLGQDDTNVISCARMLRNPRNYDEQIGALVIDVSEKYLYDILSGIELTHKESIYILDNEGKVVSYSDKSKIGTGIFNDNDLKLLQGTTEGIFEVGKGASRSFVIHKTLKTTGWKLVATMPVSEITGRSNVFNNVAGVVVIIITLIIFMLAVFLIFAFLAESMTKRIKQLVSIMRKDGIENLDESINIRDGDINVLEKSVDSMMQTVHNLMKESYQAKMHEREAQLKALQAQINPHFLYNTLDTINWMAIRINAEDISQMVDSLAKYFRLSLNKGRDIVTVADELSLAQVYLEIQKMRFVDSFTVEFDVEDEVKQYCMPKLVLQPIIENALLHGIQKKRDRKGSLKIEARKLDKDILLIVIDDGVGMEPEKAESLLSGNLQQSEPNSKGSSYGLYNVNERIKLFSGEGYGIRIITEKDKGTRVEIKLKGVTGNIR